MTKKTSRETFERSLYLSAALIIVLAGVKMAASFIVPMLLAAFVSLLALPMLFWLRQKKVPNIAAVLIVVMCIGSIGGALGISVGASLHQFSEQLPAYKESLRASSDALIVQLAHWGVDAGDYRDSVANMINPSSALGMAASTIKGVSFLFTRSFMIMLTVVFILLEAVALPRKLRAVLSDPDRTFSNFSDFMKMLQTYLVIKTIVCCITGIIVGMWLWLLGVDYPLLWGLVAFALNYVPTIGSILAAIPAILLGIVQFGPSAILSVGICYLSVNVLMGNIIEPKVMGDGVGLSTLVVFLSLVFWGWMLGPVGMLLSVPLTMILKIACLSSPTYRHIGILLGPSPPIKRPE